eukprot:CAMPEP_0206511378 /NCGR_PEP_ID=MMETSP0324_2-20121206/60256_1 /ASSEMBLY_ACC=CAM_ASM_000836 /TAXON_ID=2866 /ORGANISM="Crypthecodinium cohnii, Strain Seligo" /LENGTH=56 /DNA_ID=CAMNT_0054003149 /DNA_START=115 /DNA_END=285 /DNA_ORIENTATION=-
MSPRQGVPRDEGSLWSMSVGPLFPTPGGLSSDHPGANELFCGAGCGGGGAGLGSGD